MALQNNICAEWNNEVVDNLQRNLNTLDSANSILDETATLHRSDFLLPEFLQTLETISPAPAQLPLKLRAPVMLFQNLTPPEKMCNGTHL